MNCNDAKELIDLLVHDAAACSLPYGRGSDSTAEDAREIKTPAQWAELEAHLAGCAKCRSEVEELRRVRGLLAEVSGDRPSDKEIETMWAAIQTPISVREPFTTEKTKGWWARNRSMIISLTGAAAVIMLAFQIGRFRYGERFADVVAASNMKGIGTSAKSYFDGNAAGLNEPTIGLSPSSVVKDAGYGTEQLRPAPSTPARKALEALGYVSASPAPVLGQSAPPLPAPIGRLGRGQVRSSDKESALRESGPIFGQDALAMNLKEPNRSAGAAGGSQSFFSGGRVSADEVGPAGPSVSSSFDSAQIYSAQFWPSNALKVFSDQETILGSPTPMSEQRDLKIIKTGELAMEVPVYNDAVERVEKIAAQGGAFVADASTKEEAGGALVGRMVIRTSPDRFEEVFAALKAVGRVEAENVKAADVTAEFVDTEARIHSLKITEERLRELIANKSFVDKIASLLEVERELNRVRTEIEKFEGQLRVMADRIALSTIVLTLREPGRTVPSASLSVEVATLDEASQRLADLLGKTGGRLVSAKTSKRNDGTLMGNFQLETTLAHFAEVVAGVEALGRVQERQVTDQQFGKADGDWAQHVKCAIALVLFERSRQLPSGVMRIEVDDLEQAIARISEILKAHDASLTSNQASRQTEASNLAELRIRVPAGRFAELLEALSSAGRIVTRTVSGETDGIRGGASAVPCELALTVAEPPRETPHGSMHVEVVSFESARQTLSNAISKQDVQVLSTSSQQRTDGTWQGTLRLGVPAGQMESFVKSVESLGRVVNREINGLGLGDFSRTDPDAIGILMVSMGEKLTIAPASSQSAGAIRMRIREGLEGFYTSMGLIAYGLVVLLPWLVLAALFVWIVSRITRRRRMERTVAQLAK